MASLYSYLAYPLIDTIKANLIGLYNYTNGPTGVGNRKDYEILLKIYRKEAPCTSTALKDRLLALAPSTSSKINALVYEVAGKPHTSDPHWGEHHAPKNLNRLCKAIQKYVFKKFDTLDPKQKGFVATKFYEYAGKPATSNPSRWGLRHAKDRDKVEILIRSLAASPPIFNNEKNQKNKSSYYDLGRRELAHGQISYINGMGVSKSHAKRDAEKLSTNIAERSNFHCVYAASNGKVQDCSDAVLGYGGVITPPVQLLQKQWKAFFDKNGRRAKYLQICHSKGAIHVKNALQSFDEKLRKQITVLALAPADFIPKELCGRVRHYVIEADSVPFMSPSASRIYKGDPDIVILPPNQGTSPHNLHGKSYQTAAKAEVLAFTRSARS